MNHVDTDARPGFRPVAATDSAQAATLVVEAGETVGGPANVHPDSDQWVYVVDGHGEATVESETVSLSPGDLLVVERGESHAIAAGDRPLRTLSLYVPPRSDLAVRDA